MSDEAHSRLSPSSSHRWVLCPGSVTMCEQFPQPSGPNEAADEGTASHWVASEQLVIRPVAGPGVTAPNGVRVNEDMIEAAMVYVDEVLRIANGAVLHVEDRLPAHYIHKECFGTIDTWFLSMNRKEIHIWDYKYGFGIVEPYENHQLICYAAAVIQKLSLDGLQDQEVDVVMHIVQPRPFHREGPHRTWRVKGSDLRGYHNKLSHAANLALGPDPNTLSGNHCKYCSARHACIAAQQAALFAIDYTGEAVPAQLSLNALAIELRTMERAANAIQYRLTGLKAQAEAAIKAGQVVPGWSLEVGQGRAAWVRPLDEIFALGDLMGVDLRVEAAATPAQARKKGISADLIAAYSAAGNGAAKLVPFTTTLASRVFRGQ
jgi:hypothetical protein